MSSTCQKCNSDRILSASAHASDLHSYSMKGKEKDGYLPDDFGIGGGDDMEIKLCLNCGQLQGQWPLPVSEFESEMGTAGRFWTCEYAKCGWEKNPMRLKQCDNCDRPRPSHYENGNSLEPKEGSDYKNRQTGRTFKVLEHDEEFVLVEYKDGRHEQIEHDDWNELDLIAL